MSNLRQSQMGGGSAAQHDDDEEVYETFGAQDDFDLRNEENNNYSKYTASYMQDSDKIDQENVNQKTSQKIFNNHSEQSKINRYVLQKSRQTHIGNRLISIRLEMQKLQKQLQENHELNISQQQQASAANDALKKNKKEESAAPSLAANNIKKSDEDLKISKEQIEQFQMLKQKLIKIYGMQGFKNMVKSNPNISQFLGVIQQDFIREGDDQNMISAQVTGRQINMMEFNRMIEKMRYAHNQKQQEKDEWNQNPAIKINILYDKTRKDIGVLLRLNHLKKRLDIIKYLTGNWKPTTKKYATMTDQVVYVQKKLELLNEAKIAYFHKRAATIKAEVEELHQRSNEDNKDKLQKRENEIGHNNELITKLFRQAKPVKVTLDNLPNVVDKIEQKQKMHDMAAQILLTIEKLEKQQQNILKSTAEENKDVLEALQKGMKANQETIKQNVEMLKAKIGVQNE